MSRPLPWEHIATPKADYNVRLTTREMAIPVYWGKDVNGQSLVIIELTGDQSAEFNRAPLVVHGLNIDLRAGDKAGTQRLVLTLQQHINADLFFSLCETLIAALLPVTDSTVAMSVSLSHIRRWKAFLSGKRTGVLSSEEVRGLFAELLFLRNLYRSWLPRREAIDAWCGADRVQQDFIFRDTTVEVKSLSGKERNSVRISSESQLETLTSRLFLKVYRLTDFPDSPRGHSLNNLVSLIESELTDACSVEKFTSKLAANGYAPLRDYDAPVFVVSDEKTFKVTESFPKLVRSALPPGIARLSYDLELESLEPYECRGEIIMGELDGSNG